MQENLTKRDNTLDALRGCTMLYIVVIIHGLTSYGYLHVHSLIISILLFEMPLMFFISGASITMASSKSIQLFVVSRIKRVIISYSIWGLLAFLIMLFRDGNISCLNNILVADNVDGLPFCNQLWFIKPYLAVSIFGYFLFTVIHTIKNSQVFAWMCFGGGKH